ncbi:substrate-binding domain-containing protein [Mycolicibacterium sp. 120266]|jgi:ribose transport system substrate-binding protein|uniref:sugar ABC transporter substrate-binding protein n=1 Tax=Mycolicibacterium sp. 120266 TaxID=3090601 RepID=UPI0004196B59|nr:substrate-binding domain-containing protein [Mycolicibacterium sp. 120266]MDX1873011.1 substrate-binding domain-containing protein [Mycolicibacterium sp. 120266]
MINPFGVAQRRATLAAVLCGALAITTVGCNRTPSESNSSSGARIAIVTRDFTNPYWAALRDGAIAEGKKQGVEVTVQAGSSETDSAGENTKISTMAAQDFNCFGVVPVNATNVITPLVPVAKKGIPILNLDTQIDAEASKAAGVSYASFIGSDNLAAGKQAGEALMADMGGHGDVAVLQGIAGEQNGINRLKGFTEATQGKLQIVATQPADYDQNLALTVTQDLLRAHPSITGIFAANDTMGLGAAQAVKNAGKSGQISIISVDGITAALQAVKDGTLSGTISQYPYAEGQLAVQACVNLVAKKPVPERVVAPIQLIDKSNVDKAMAAFPQPFQPFDNPITGGK